MNASHYKSAKSYLDFCAFFMVSVKDSVKEMPGVLTKVERIYFNTNSGALRNELEVAKIRGELDTLLELFHAIQRFRFSLEDDIRRYLGDRICDESLEYAKKQETLLK